MKRIVPLIFLLGFVFPQSIIDTLSVTVYPEFADNRVFLEYKFDNNSLSEYKFDIPGDVDSVKYIISSNSSKILEENVKINNNSLTTIRQNGNHAIYIFLNKFINNPGPRNFAYTFQSYQDIRTLIFSFQIPFASENFICKVDNILMEKIQDQNGLSFMQGITENSSFLEKKNLSFNYYNTHGLGSIQYATNITNKASAIEPRPTAREKFINYPFLTWEPMLIFLILTLILVFLYEISNRRKSN